MKTVTMDERRSAARINLVDEHVRAENAHELDGTMATLNETPLFKLNNDEVVGHDGVRATGSASPLLGSKRADWEESAMTQLRRGIVGVIAAFVVVSLSFSAQAAEKKKIMGTNKHGPWISRTLMPLGPGDDPKHQLFVFQVRRDTTTSPDPDWNETEQIVYEQSDEVAGTGTHRGYFVRFHKNGDIDYGPYEGTHKATLKEDGSWESTTWEGTFKVTGGTGKFKNAKGGGTYRGKATAERASTEFEGELEY